MIGNVGEWCSDWMLGALPEDAAIDPTGPILGVQRVIRGGCGMLCGPKDSRSAWRSCGKSDFSFFSVGFRLELSEDDPNEDSETKAKREEVERMWNDFLRAKDDE